MKPRFAGLIFHHGVRLSVIVVFAFTLPAHTQVVPATRIQSNSSSYLEYRFSEALFGVFAWLNTGAYLTGDTLKQSSRVMMISKILEEELTPEQKDSLTEDYDTLKSKYGWMLGYIATVVAINCSDPPDMQTKMQEISAWDKLHGKNSSWILDRLEEWTEFLPGINEFWTTPGLREIAEQIKTVSDPVGYTYLSQADSMIKKSLKYFRIPDKEYLQDDMGILMVNLIGPEGEMGPDFCGIRYDIKGPSFNNDFRPHEFIHSLTDKFTKDTLYAQQITRIVEACSEKFAGTAGASSYPDPVIFFDECLVRTIDHLVISGWESPDMRNRVYKGLEGDYRNGFVLVHDLFNELSGYEASGITFEDYFVILLNNLLIKTGCERP